MADDTATVTLMVRAVNDLPVATSDTYFSTEDITLAVAAPGVLGNDTDVDGDALVASIVAPPDHCELDLGPDGSFTYTPAPDFNGTDGFTYGLSDTKGGIVSGTVAISVAPANDAPVAQDDADTTLVLSGRNSPVVIEMLPPGPCTALAMIWLFCRTT